MSGHTPGPWHVCEMDWRVVESQTDHVIADVRSPLHLNGRADAMLIAAAPELLAALKQIASQESVLVGGGRAVLGNEKLPADAGDFYRGYNAGIKTQLELSRKLAQAALDKAEGK